MRTLTFCGANSYEMLRSSAGTSTPRGMNTSPLYFAMACRANVSLTYKETRMLTLLGLRLESLG